MKTETRKSGRNLTRWRATLRAAFVLYVAASTGYGPYMCSDASAQTGFSGGLAAPPLPGASSTPESDALLQRLISLADSTSTQDQNSLARQLTDVATIDLLDAPKERNRRTPQDLRIARVFDHLRKNPSAAAATLAALYRSADFNGDWRLQALVIWSLGTQRPLRAESVAYLDAQSQPTSPNLQNVIITLIENESIPAIALLGRKMEDSNLGDNDKIAWIRYRLLPKRRSAPLLAGLEKWFAGGKLDATVRTALAEALFDYRPREWGGEDLPAPPDERTTSAEAAKVLRRIGTLVLSSEYPSSVKDAVRQTLTKLP